ncbi:MAG: FkbM family methyltransferase [Candidatus Liptonbacteria bacterium]|nr:FkbM family methyltransferase [Candidatus Liptonbacteria bacterium]
MIKEICEHNFLGNLLDENSFVLDLGGNRGEFARRISEDFGCKVLTFEPLRELFERIPANNLVQKINKAVGVEDGYLDLSWGRGMDITVVEKSESSIRVPSVAFTNILKQNGKVDLIKIDIEGEEVQILGAATPDDLKDVNQMTIEFHDFLYPELKPRVEKIKAKLESAGFYCIPFSLTNNGDVLFVKKSLISKTLYFYLKFIVKFFLAAKRKPGRLYRKYYRMLSGVSRKGERKSANDSG